MATKKGVPLFSPLSKHYIVLSEEALSDAWSLEEGAGYDAFADSAVVVICEDEKIGRGLAHAASRYLPVTVCSLDARGCYTRTCVLSYLMHGARRFRLRGSTSVSGSGVFIPSNPRRRGQPSK